MASRKSKASLSSRLVFGLGHGEEALHQALAKSAVEIRGFSEEGPPTMAKSILNVLNGPGQEISRLGFESDPTQISNITGGYHAKYRLVPDFILKRIAIQDSLVSNIVRGRQEQGAPFGRKRPTRFDCGFVMEPKPGVTDGLDEDQKKELKKQIERGIELLSTCGHTEGVQDHHQKTLSEWMSMSIRSAVVVGRIATEVVRVEDEQNPGENKFHYFVAMDAGTVYRANNQDKNTLDSIRREAYHLLSQVAGQKLIREPHPPEAEDYAWVQVIDGKAVQVFTNDELKVMNFYPVPDVELDGYPVTPIDTIISAVTTHINITTHNKLYFQSGRATRGMLVINSDSVTPQTVHNIKQHFNASINNVNNSWRMPVFGCAVDEKITWTPIDTGGARDMEFQYLTDMNAREILSAFMMSPDELPGWTYLSRGTNNQSLSEGNNEYKLEAARDLGIRPLLSKFEDFINQNLMPLIDPDLAKKVDVRLKGLDADNAEKEAVRTQQDMGIWMTFDDVLERVEKQPVGAEWCGTIPLNPAYQAVLYAHKTVGEIEEEFLGIKGASKDPQRQYRRDPYFFQWIQFMQQQQAAQQQAQAAAQGPPGGGPSGGPGGGQPPQGGQDGSQGGDGGGKGAHAFDAQTENQKTEQSKDASGAGALGKAIDQAFELYQKSEDQLPPEERRLMAQHRKTLEYFMKGLQEDAHEAVQEILDVAKKSMPS